MAFLDLDYSKIKGYEKLSPMAKDIFKRTYELHNSCVGTDYKVGWSPISVEECSSYLKVYFKNGDWLHYYSNSTWG